MKTRIVYLIGTVVLAVGAIALMFTVLSARAATTAVTPITWTDQFITTTLQSRWSWIREDPTQWSLSARPDFLQITTQPITTINNILVQTAPPGNYEIQTRVIFTPTANFQAAGLVVYQDDNNMLTLSHEFCDTPTRCSGNAIYFDYLQNGTFIDGNFATPITQTDTSLRIVRAGDVYTGFVSTNGTDWTTLGAHTVTIHPTKIGLRASNQSSAPSIPADFDYFTLIDSSLRLYLPLISVTK